MSSLHRLRTAGVDQTHAHCPHVYIRLLSTRPSQSKESCQKFREIPMRKSFPVKLDTLPLPYTGDFRAENFRKCLNVPKIRSKFLDENAISSSAPFLRLHGRFSCRKISGTFDMVPNLSLGHQESRHNTRASTIPDWKKVQTLQHSRVTWLVCMGWSIVTSPFASTSVLMCDLYQWHRLTSLVHWYSQPVIPITWHRGHLYKVTHYRIYRTRLYRIIGYIGWNFWYS